MAQLQPNGSYLQLLSGHTLNDYNTTAVYVHNNRLHNYPLCIERSRMCCLTVIVPPQACEPLKSAAPDKSSGQTVHSQKFLMRSLSCWLLKASGVVKVAPTGEQIRKKKNNHQDVFLTVMIRLLLPSLQRKALFKCSSYQGKRSIRVSDGCVCVCVCLW